MPTSEKNLYMSDEAFLSKAQGDKSRYFGTFIATTNATHRSVSDPISVKASRPLATTLRQSEKVSEKPNQAARPPPRTPSTDSAISSLSTGNQPNYAQDVVTAPEIESLVAAAGSAEPVISYLLKEKKTQAAQNSQLWRLVDKQRAMILGLNKDLERALKDKERYRKKMKDTIAHFTSSMNLSLLTIPNEPQIPISESPRPRNKENESSRMMDDLEGHSDYACDLSQDTTEVLNTVEIKDQKQSPVETPIILLHASSTVKQSHTSPNPDNATRKTPYPDYASPIQIHISESPITLHFQTPLQNPTSFRHKSPSLPLPEEYLKEPKDLKRFSSAGINMPTNISKIEDEDQPKPRIPPAFQDPTYTNLYKDEVPSPRGRRNTRAEDDKARALPLSKESEEKSPHDPRHISSSTPITPIEPKSPVPDSVLVESSLPPPNQPQSQTSENPESSAFIDQPDPPDLSPLRSPLTRSGLPSSPRPVKTEFAPSPILIQFPMNSPTLSKESKPLDADQMSTRNTFAESNLTTPKLPQTPSADLSPLEPHQKGLILNSPRPLIIKKKDRNIDGSKDDDLPLRQRPHYHLDGIYRGLITEEFPDLLLSPNSLTLVDIKVASSRLKPTRASIMFPKNSEEDPVFTLALFFKSNSNELWRVEKDLPSLAQLDHTLKQSSTLAAKIPEKSLFSGHAPAKVDARRLALNYYLDKVLECPLSITAALEVCRYLSSNVLEAYAEDNTSKSINEHGQEFLVKKNHGGKPLKQGYLTKRGKNFGGWKSRYFELGGPVLKYYESPGGPHLGAIRLQQAQIGKQSQPSEKSSQSAGNGDGSDRQYRHAFLILEPKRKDSSSLVRHVLCAESDLERDQWVDALCQYIDYKDLDEKASVSTKLTESNNSRSPRNTSDPKLIKKALDQKKQIELDLSEESLRGVSYENTKHGSRPMRAPKGANVGNSSTRGGPDRDSPTPGSMSHDQLSKNSSSPLNGQAMPDISGRGNGQESSETVSDDRIKQKKKSFFGFGTKLRVPSESADTAAVEINNSFSSPTNEQLGHNRVSFGVSLADAVKYNHPVDVDVELPAVVYRCVEYLNSKNATSEEGIFRLSGSNIIIRQLKERFNNEGDINLIKDEQYHDVHAVASLLKLYLRELPTTILTREYYLDFLAVSDLIDINEKVGALNGLVNKLPRPNITLLKYLASFLIEIIDNSDINRMTVRNVGIVFSPTLNIPASVFSLFLQQYVGIFGDQPNHRLRQTESNSSAQPSLLEGPGPDIFKNPSYDQSSSPSKAHLRAALDNHIIPLNYYRADFEATKGVSRNINVASKPASQAHMKSLGGNSSGKTRKRDSSMFGMNMVSLGPRRTSTSKPGNIRKSIPSDSSITKAANASGVSQ